MIDDFTLDQSAIRSSQSVTLHSNRKTARIKSGGSISFDQPPQSELHLKVLRRPTGGQPLQVWEESRGIASQLEPTQKHDSWLIFSLSADRTTRLVRLANSNTASSQPILIKAYIRVYTDTQPYPQGWFQPISARTGPSVSQVSFDYPSHDTESYYDVPPQNEITAHIPARSVAKIQIRRIFGPSQTRSQRACLVRLKQGTSRGYFREILSHPLVFASLTGTDGGTVSTAVGTSTSIFAKLRKAPYTLRIKSYHRCAIRISTFSPDPGNTRADLASDPDNRLFALWQHPHRNPLETFDKESTTPPTADHYPVAKARAQYIRNTYLYYRDLEPNHVNPGDRWSDLPYALVPEIEPASRGRNDPNEQVIQDASLLPKCQCIQFTKSRRHVEYANPLAGTLSQLRLLIDTNRQNISQKLQLILKGDHQVSRYEIRLSPTVASSPNSTPANVYLFDRRHFTLPKDIKTIRLKKLNHNASWPAFQLQVLDFRQPELTQADVLNARNNPNPKKLDSWLEIFSDRSSVPSVDQADTGLLKASRTNLRLQKISIDLATSPQRRFGRLKRPQDPIFSKMTHQLAKDGQYYLLERLCHWAYTHPDSNPIIAYPCLRDAFDAQHDYMSVAALGLSMYHYTNENEYLIAASKGFLKDARPLLAGLILAHLSEVNPNAHRLLKQLGERYQWAEFGPIGHSRPIHEPLSLKVQHYPNKVSIRQPLTPEWSTGYQLETGQSLSFQSPPTTSRWVRVEVRRPIDITRDYQSLSWIRFASAGKTFNLPFRLTGMSPDWVTQDGERLSFAEVYYLRNSTLRKITLTALDAPYLIRISSSRPQFPQSPHSSKWDVYLFPHEPLDRSILTAFNQLWATRTSSKENMRLALQSSHLANLLSKPVKSWRDNELIQIFRTGAGWDFVSLNDSTAGVFKQLVGPWAPDHPQLAQRQQLLPQPSSANLGVISSRKPYLMRFNINRPTQVQLALNLHQILPKSVKNQNRVGLKLDEQDWQFHSLDRLNQPIKLNLSSGPHRLAIRFTNRQPGQYLYVKAIRDQTGGHDSLRRDNVKYWSQGPLTEIMPLPQASPTLLRIHRFHDDKAHVSYHLVHNSQSLKHIDSLIGSGPIRVYRLALEAHPDPAIIVPSEPSPTPEPVTFTRIQQSDLEHQSATKRIFHQPERSGTIAGHVLSSHCSQKNRQDLRGHSCTQLWSSQAFISRRSLAMDRQYDMRMSLFPGESWLTKASLTGQWATARKEINARFASDLLYGQANYRQNTASVTGLVLQPSLNWSWTAQRWLSRSRISLTYRQLEFDQANRSFLWPQRDISEWKQQHDKIATIHQSFGYKPSVGSQIKSSLHVTSNSYGEPSIVDQTGLAITYFQLWNPLFSTAIGYEYKHYLKDRHRVSSTEIFGPKGSLYWIYPEIIDHPVVVKFEAGMDTDQPQTVFTLSLATTLDQNLTQAGLSSLNFPFYRQGRANILRRYTNHTRRGFHDARN